MPPPPKSQLPDGGKEIKVEHVRSESQTSLSNKGSIFNVINPPPNFSFEEHHSIIEDEEEEYGIPRNKSINSIDEHFRMRNDLTAQTLDDEHHQLRLYEEKLKQTLYEEYLLRLEREKLEKKLTESGLFDQRIRERSNSHDRCSSLYSNARFSENMLNNNNAEYLLKEREHELKEQQRLRDHQILIEQNRSRPNFVKNRLNESFETNSETSTYKNIKFSKVIDQNELRRLNDILTNPNTPSITSKTEGDRIMSSFEDASEMASQSEQNKKQQDTKKQQHPVRQTNEMAQKKLQQQEPRNYQHSSTGNFSNVKV